MKFRGRLVITLATALLGAGSVVAEPAPTPPLMDDAGIRTFLQACAHIGDLSATDSYLRGAGFTPAPQDFAARLLKGGTGDVWLMPLPDRVAIVTQPDGQLCRVYIQGGDADKEEKYFVRIIEGLARPGLSVTKTSDQKISSGKWPTHYLAYRVGAKPAKIGATDRLFSIGVTDSPGAPLSTIMTAAAVKPN
jgi:hypothetical protein